MRKILFFSSLILIVLMISCAKQETISDYGSEKRITGRVVVNTEESPEGAIKEVCENAQTYEICYDLNIKLRGDYKEECCNRYDLCC